MAVGVRERGGGGLGLFAGWVVVVVVVVAVVARGRRSGAVCVGACAVLLLAQGQGLYKETLVAWAGDKLASCATTKPCPLPPPPSLCSVPPTHTQDYLVRVRKQLDCRSITYTSLNKESHVLEVPEAAAGRMPASFSLVGHRKGFKRYSSEELAGLVADKAAAEEERERVEAGVLRVSECGRGGCTHMYCAALGCGGGLWWCGGWLGEGGLSVLCGSDGLYWCQESGVFQVCPAPEWLLLTACPSLMCRVHVRV